MDKRQHLRDGLLNIALKWGQGVGRDGKGYGWMIDCRELLLQGDYLEVACQLLWDKLKVYQPASVGGLTLAANPLTIGLMHTARGDGNSIKGLLIRRSAKEDGLQRQVEGPQVEPGEVVVLVDDLVNSGDTQRAALAALRPSFCRVAAVGVLIDYQRQGSHWLLQQGIPIESLFTLAELGMQASDAQWAQPTSIWGSLNSNQYQAPKSRPCIRGDRLWVGSDQGEMLCLSLQGNLIWRARCRDRQRGFHATPCWQEGKLVAGSYDGYLQCWDAQDGQLVWEHRCGQWIGSSACGSEGVVYVGLEYGRQGGAVEARRLSGGDRIWRHETRHYVHSSPTLDIDRGCLLIGCNDGAVRALELESGQLQWEYLARSRVRSDVVVDSAGVAWFCCAKGWLYAVKQGQLIWERQLGRQAYCTPCLCRDLVVAGGDSGRLLAFERISGRLKWVAPTPDGLMGGPTLGPDDTLLVAEVSGKLSWLNSDGQLLGGWKVSRPFLGRPVCVGNQVYLAGGALSCLRLTP